MEDAPANPACSPSGHDHRGQRAVRIVWLPARIDLRQGKLSQAKGECHCKENRSHRNTSGTTLPKIHEIAVLRTGFSPAGTGLRLMSGCPPLHSVSLSFHGDRRVLGITFQTELGNIQTFEFHFGGHADTLDLIHYRKHHVSPAKCPDCTKGCADQLREKLSAVPVKQAGNASARVSQVEDAPTPFEPTP